MGRIITFKLNNSTEFFDFGTYALINYYAKQLSLLSSKKLLEAGLTEYEYRWEYELPLDGFTPDDEIAHFVPSDVEDVVVFLENELIPALNNEVKNLIEIYGGKKSFVKLFYTNPEHLAFLGISEDDFFEGDGEQLSFQLSSFKVFLQSALASDTAYSVVVD